MPYSSTLTTISEEPELVEERADDAVNYESSFSCSSVKVKACSFFDHSRGPLAFPDSYEKIWNKIKGNSNQKKIKALLLNYTNENYLLGSFIGCVFSGHWKRNHISAVSKIITNMSVKNYYESAEDIVADLKTIKFEKKGSLYQRIKFIEMKLDKQLKCEF